VLQKIRIGVVVITALIGYSQSASAWTRTADFEKGQVNSTAEGTDAFDRLAGRSIYTTENAFSGAQAAKLRVREGEEGYGEFGGVIDFPKEVTKGDEVWIRLRAYFPGSYIFLDEPQINKFFRVRTEGPQKGKRWANIYMNDSRTEFEMSAAPWHRVRDSGPPRGKWETYELYLRFDDKPLDGGGQGIARVWIDGQLKGEFSDVSTLAEPKGVAHALNVFTWWGNDGPPRDLFLYVDDIKMTTRTPNSVDAEGNPHIGLGNDPRPSSPDRVKVEVK